MSWTRRAHKLFELMHRQGRELERKDLVLRLDMSEKTASKVLAALKAAGCIRFAYGSCRRGVFYEFLPGSRPPADGRGKSENSRKALRRHASRPPRRRDAMPAALPSHLKANA
jgi:hypothetical protein